MRHSEGEKGQRGLSEGQLGKLCPFRNRVHLVPIQNAVSNLSLRLEKVAKKEKVGT